MIKALFITVTWWDMKIPPLMNELEVTGKDRLMIST